MYTRVGLTADVHRCRYSTAFVYYGEGRLEQVPVLLAQAETIFRHNRLPVDVARCQYLNALLSRDQGRLAEAADLLTRAEKTFRREKQSAEAGQCRDVLAAILDAG
jgi:hypothetical protein